MTSDEVITAELVAELVAAQFPAWADLAIRPVELDGWENRTFRLGDEMSVRLPSGAAYAAQVGKEGRWLPALAPRLPVPIPQPPGRPAKRLRRADSCGDRDPGRQH
ncbi:MAG TPA: phosphotransferase [Streptosporangiaceae bacterium]|jgi:aminoglycoside phosphotransferase (APT) family kinase protein